MNSYMADWTLHYIKHICFIFSRMRNPYAFMSYAKLNFVFWFIKLSLIPCSHSLSTCCVNIHFPSGQVSLIPARFFLAHMPHTSTQILSPPLVCFFSFFYKLQTVFCALHLRGIPTYKACVGEETCSVVALLAATGRCFWGFAVILKLCQARPATAH